MSSKIAPGLLIAAPPLKDPNFKRSVILLASHGEEGAFGWVLNGQSMMSLQELVDYALTEEEKESESGELRQSAVLRSGRGGIVKGSTGSIRMGGPVGREQVWLLYRSEDRIPLIEEQIEIAPGLLVSPSMKILDAMIEGCAPSRVLGVMGYAGWDPEQLEEEIKNGSWLPTDLDPSILFDVPCEDMWQHCYHRIGISPLMFTTKTIGQA